MKIKTYIIPLLIGVLFIIVGVMALDSCFDVTSSYQKTDAVVTSCEMKVEYDSDDNKSTVFYTNADYTVNGESFSIYGKLHHSHLVGDKVIVYYDKAAPDVCEFQDNIHSRIVMGLNLIFFGILFFVGIFLSIKRRLSGRLDPDSLTEQ